MYKQLFLIIFAGLWLSAMGHQPQETPENIHWVHFKWGTSDNHYNLPNPKAFMIIHPSLENLDGQMEFHLNLNIPQNILYQRGYNNLTWRNPGIASKIESLQGAGTTQRKILKEIEIGFQGNILAIDEFQIRENPDEDSRVFGVLGFNVFAKNQTILVIDYPGQKIAFMKALPEQWMEKVLFTPMDIHLGYIQLPIMAGRKKVTLAFDGTSRSALVITNKSLYNQMITNEKTTEKLWVRGGGLDGNLLEGHLPQTMLRMGNMPLKPYNVYYWPEGRISKSQGYISQAFFDDYVLILDYPNRRFGLLRPSDL